MWGLRCALCLAFAAGAAGLRFRTSVAAATAPRRQVFGAALAGLAGGGAARAAVALEPKSGKLGAAELAKIVTADVVDRQFLATADFTRSLYDESATFTDEIDTYTLDKWIQGTGLLFKNDYSKMELASPISITKDEASFAFKEQLMFNIPILKPKVPLTGKLVLTRGGNGLFTSYKESWDQGVAQVLLSAKLF